MTQCFKGGHGHDFPYEDDTGAYCEEHGVTLLWHGDPVTRGDLGSAYPGVTRRNGVPPHGDPASPAP